MSVDERLRGWAGSGPDPDAEAMLVRVRRAARRRHRRRLAGFGAAALLVSGVAAAGVDAGVGSGDTEVDTAGPGVEPPVRYLPVDVPDGYELHRVDDHAVPAGPPTQAELWDPHVVPAYSYGYRSDIVEIDVDVFPGYRIDSSAVVASADTIEYAAFEIAGAVVRLAPHGIDSPPLGGTDVDLHFLEMFARSFRVVDEEHWRSHVAAR